MIVYACISAFVFGVYILIDTQLIIGGKQYAIDPEEYIFAAMSLYLDIILLFRYILIIVGLLDD